jgi:Zn-finger nucleic acid-binding protein
VAPESVAGEETRLPCPACGEEHVLSGRRVAEVPVLECERCAGLWLSNQTIKQLTQRAASQGVNVAEDFAPCRAAPPGPQRGGLRGQRYRKCPQCGDIMYRRNYARRSGVVIDVCRKHGAWFDAEELPRIMAWVRDGGLARARRDVAKEEERKERWDKVFESDRTPQRTSPWMDVAPQARGAGLADVLVEAMFKFFG